MRKILSLLLLLVAGVFFVSCDEKVEEGELDVQFAVPESAEVNYGDKEMTFRIMFGKAPLKSDIVVFGDPTGALFDCPIVSISSSSFTVSLYDGLVSGTYNIYIQRGSSKKKMGVMNLEVRYKSESDTEINLKEGNNVYGVVACGKQGIKDVVVSDGVEVVKTDANGVYQFKSMKEHKYVFISVPSGYEVMSEGVLPRMHQQLVADANTAERVDFPLVEAGDQTNHTMMFFGDIHLANRTKDRSQFANFTSEINEYLTANPGRKTYAMTLGDMTWELYWVSNKYSFEEYLVDVNAIKGLSIFHTIGNHDHDMYYSGDFDTVTKYKKMIAPTYYSFNIGEIHYVVLDDIECQNTGAGTSDSRKYVDRIVSQQVKWLQKDLSYVPTSTPVVVTSHAQYYNDSNNASLDNLLDIEAILSKYDDVHIFTGHTHKMYNVDKTDVNNIFEHNAGAVCATWWWTGNYTTGMHIAQDGAPGGYSIVDFTGEDMKWQFKGTGRDISHQFRTYDRNTITLTADKYVASGKSDSDKKKFEDAAADWVSIDKGNYVYINVWNYDPKWTIDVTEDGKTLEVVRVAIKDPLHLISYNAKTPGGGFGTSVTKHMFRVQASSATSTLEIKVTDRFGNVYTESMKRPKTFSMDTYIK